MKIRGFRFAAVTSIFAFALALMPLARAATVPQAPGYAKATLKVIVDNDYAAFMGDDNNVTRLFNQNNVDWSTQISNAASLDIYPQTGETYIYLAVMGGGGTEDWAGKLNGFDVVDVSGAQVATSRTPAGTSTTSSPYVLLQTFITGYNSTSVAAGTQNVTLADLQTALTGVAWTSAVQTGSGSGNVPLYKTSGVCCGSTATSAGMSGKGWNFPSDSLVVFRYPLSSLGLPVRAGDSRVTVDWDAPAAGDAPTSYIVQYKKSSDPDSSYTTFSTVAAASTIETVTGLTNGTFYSFRVAGVNSYGTGAYSVVREAMPYGPPPAPTALSPLPKASSVQISFTDPITNGGSAITNYQYSIDGGSTWTAFSPVDTTTPATITGLTDGTTYSISLRAVNTYGAGAIATVVASIPGLIGRASNLVVSGTPAKGVPSSVSVTLNIVGKVNFLVDGKKIANCIKIATSGSAPNISASCTWKPTVTGQHRLSVQHFPTDTSYATGSLTGSFVQVVKRVTTR